MTFNYILLREKSWRLIGWLKMKFCRSFRRSKCLNIGNSRNFLIHCYFNEKTASHKTQEPIAQWTFMKRMLEIQTVMKETHPIVWEKYILDYSRHLVLIINVGSLLQSRFRCLISAKNIIRKDHPETIDLEINAFMKKVRPEISWKLSLHIENHGYWSIFVSDFTPCFRMLGNKIDDNIFKQWLTSRKMSKESTISDIQFLFWRILSLSLQMKSR